MYWNHIETLLQTNVCRFYIQFGVNLEGLKYPKLDEVSTLSWWDWKKSLVRSGDIRFNYFEDH